MEQQTRLSEALVHNREHFIQLVTQAYMSAEPFDVRAAKHWNALFENSFQWLTKLTEQLKLSLKDKNTLHTLEAIVHSGHANTAPSSNHPCFTAYQYRIVRLVHDYLMHVILNYGFGPTQELQAYNAYAKLYSPEAQPALFTEYVGHSCMVLSGQHPTPKVVVLNGFDYANTDKFQPHFNPSIERLHNFSMQ